jgi:RNA polymerase sigma factor (TIGR02999 family)
LTQPEPPDRDVTELLRVWSAGDRSALDRLVPIVYGELKRLAERYMRRQEPGHTLHATGLVHEAYLRLAGQDRGDFRSRAQFFGMASAVMRSVLVDHARGRKRAKRGGDATVLSLGAAEDSAGDEPEVDILELDEALTRFAELDPLRSRLVELRYFTGLTIEETAEVLGVSPATVKRDWVMAKAWLRRALTAA